MLKRTSNNGIFVLTESNNWYLTLADQKERLYILPVKTVIKHCEDKKKVWSKTNKKDHLVQTVSEWVNTMSHYSGAS